MAVQALHRVGPVQARRGAWPVDSAYPHMPVGLVVAPQTALDVASPSGETPLSLGACEAHDRHSALRLPADGARDQDRESGPLD
jgi:hypothetical protein